MIVFLLASSLVLLLGQSLWETQILPKDVQTFVLQGTRPIEIERADLDGDGRVDFLLVVERVAITSDTETQRDRTLLVLLKQPDGTLRLAGRSEGAVPEPDCGGPFGDCFQGVEVGRRHFTINTYGGSSWRTNASATFAYVPAKHGWYLQNATISTFHVSDPGDVSKRIYRWPRDFGRIALEDFSYESIFDFQSGRTRRPNS
jgi:hypothetical protein